MRPARSNATRRIARRRFRRPPRPVADLLRSLAEYQPVSSWPRDHRALADQVADAEPFTILLCAEPLAREHRRRKTHTTMQRVELVSALDETVFRHFERQLSARMAEWLRHHPDPEDAHLRALVRAYYPQARTLLRAELREAFPRAWRRRWAARAWSKPRLRIECRRRYDLPAPLGMWTTDIPQQFYFMRRTRTFDRGCSSSSGAREVHSYFGLAFLELTRRGTGIPCYILVYDRHNQLCWPTGCRSSRRRARVSSSACTRVSSRTVGLQRDRVARAIRSFRFSAVYGSPRRHRFAIRGVVRFGSTTIGRISGSTAPCC